jgi:subtilisin
VAKKAVRARTTRRRSRVAAGAPNAELPPLPPPTEGQMAVVETTGRFVVILKNGARDTSSVRSSLNDLAGLRNIAASSDYESGAVTSADLASSKAVHFEKLGVLVCSDEDAVQSLAASVADSDSPILAIEPEYVAFLSSQAAHSGLLDYMRGYRDGVAHLYDQVSGSGPADQTAASIAATSFQDNAQFTWGLQATGVHTSRFTGQGIKVAVLDTGFDLAHPDFRGRAIVSETFSGIPVQDTHGHGTHCIGTACGPQRPASGVRRYGVASGAQIFAGRVFDNSTPRPKAPTINVIAGIEWAMTNGCRVVSLSLGVPINQEILQYRTPLQRALDAGTLVIAAAGNNADRPASVGFVEPPANAEAAMAVAAVDRQLQIASFSGRSSLLVGVGGNVNIAGPGVAVFSSFPVARGGHGTLNGTSMATPHVAGIAALWSEMTGDTGTALWSRVLQTARSMTLPSADVGSGLVQAPQ